MILLFEGYSYILSLGYLLIDLAPVMLRKLIFKLILGGKGKGGMIDRKCYFRYPKRIFLGDNCYINRGCSFFATIQNSDKKNIVLGHHVVVGPNVTIFAGGHDPETIDENVAVSIYPRRKHIIDKELVIIPKTIPHSPSTPSVKLTALVVPSITIIEKIM